jgi:alcohol dehydrogenase (NADP+)
METLKRNAIDPRLIPYKVLSTGDKIPVIGLGTFGSDRHSHAVIAAAVKDAIRIGYRHIDCASVYMNEKEIGEAIAEVLAEGTVVREELWITSKVWNDMHDSVEESCVKTLADLQLDYLDLYLVHWPFPNYHAPGCDVDSRHPDAKPYIHENYMKTWRQMEKLVEKGLVRNIGTSNMTIPKMKLLLRDARIKPVANEMELHPHFQQKELFNFLMTNNIQPIGFSPLGSPNRPDRDRTDQDTVDTEDPVILGIADKLNIHPAAVCLKWAIQRGQIPIPFSVNPKNYFNNLRIACEQNLSQEDMRNISAIDKNCRLIKGQVFLWKDGQTWEDLWDVNGEITPP